MYPTDRAPGEHVLESTRQVERGYFVSAYSIAVGSMHLAYFKVSAAPAPSYFDVERCILKGTTSMLWSDGKAALVDALEGAERALRFMPDAKVVERQLNGRCMTFVDLYELMHQPGHFAN